MNNIANTVERLALKSIMSLPPRLILSTFGKPSVVHDNQELDPEIQVYLLIRKLLKKPGMGEVDPVLSRSGYTQDSLVHGIRINDIVSKDFDIPVTGASIKGRLYHPSQTSGPMPTLIYYHGGGFVIGDLEMFDHVCRFISLETGFKVLAVDYRKAPEYPFPTGIHDSVEAYKWAISNHTLLGIDTSCVLVGGDSAGGNLATIVGQILAEQDIIRPVLQLLIYPTCDHSKSYPSREHFGENFFLTKKDIEYFQTHYVGRDCDNFHPWISPIHAKNLSNLPPAVIVTAGFDPLRDEGEAYAERLQSEGVEVKIIREKGLIHGFINMIGFSRSSLVAFRRVLQQVKRSLK